MDCKKILSSLVGIIVVTIILPSPVFSLEEESSLPVVVHHPDESSAETTPGEDLATESKLEDVEQKKTWYRLLSGDLMLEEHRLFFDERLSFIPSSPIIISPKVELYGLTLSYDIPVESKDPGGKDMGETDVRSFQISYRINSIELIYYDETYKGFYLKDQTAPDGNYYIFPDMETERKGGELKFYYGYSSRDKMLKSLGDDKISIKWGASLSILKEDTRIRNLPQGGAFQNSSLIRFSDAEFTSYMPKAGLTFAILQKKDWTSLPKDDALFYEASIDFGQAESAGDGTDFNITFNASGIFTIA